MSHRINTAEQVTAVRAIAREIPGCRRIYQMSQYAMVVVMDKELDSHKLAVRFIADGWPNSRCIKGQYTPYWYIHVPLNMGNL